MDKGRCILIDLVRIKSTSSALELWMDRKENYGDLKLALIERLDDSNGFYQGMQKPAMFFGKPFTNEQKRELKSLLACDYGISDARFVDDEEAKEALPQQDAKTPISTERFDTKSTFIMETLRGGRRVECKGDIIVAGDVNSGAELIAGGNIAVFGKLRGLAHAGAMGDKSCVIVANWLMPKQIRIAGKIAIIPEDRDIEGTEIVKLVDDQIVVETVD